MQEEQEAGTQVALQRKSRNIKGRRQCAHVCICGTGATNNTQSQEEDTFYLCTMDLALLLGLDLPMLVGLQELFLFFIIDKHEENQAPCMYTEIFGSEQGRHFICLQT